MNIAGIDVSTHSIDVVKLPFDQNTANWTAFHGGPDIRYLERARHLTRVFPGAASSFWDDVAIVAIERPAARQRTTVEKLMLVTGIVIASVPMAVPVWLMMPSEWRRECGLKGNAAKTDVGRWTGERWVDPPTVLSQDALDAFCVAWAARAVNERAAAA